MSPTNQTKAPSPVPLVLLAGTGCDERVFDPLCTYLDGYPVLLRSLSGSRSASAAARQILQEAPATFFLGGFSLGGIVALEIVAQAPERVRGLALIATTARADHPGKALARRAAVARVRAEGAATFILDTWPVQVARHHSGREDLRDLLVEMVDSTGPDNLADQAEIAITRANSVPRLKSIAVPTLIIAGEEDAICPLEFQHEMAAEIPNSRLHIIPETGHFALVENIAAVGPAVRDWLLPEEQQAKPTPTRV